MLDRHAVLVVIIAAAASGCTKSDEEAWTAVAKSLPWMVQMLEACEGYKGATRDAEKIDFSNLGPNLASTVEVSQARGEVEKIFPIGEGEPTGYALQINVEGKVRFSTDAEGHRIDQSSPVFAAVGGLRRAQCVVFSATSLTPISGSEMGRVCDFSYYAKFTSIAPCP